MAKGSVYVCSNCGYTSSQWYGRCPSCHAWGTLEEKSVSGGVKKSTATGGVKLKPFPVKEVDTSEERLHIDKYFDDFFGGGLVRGGVYLFSGSPGVGKSTLLLQMAQKLASNGYRVIYVSSEESVSQVSSRAKRLSVSDIYVVSHNDIDDIAGMMESEKPECVVLDSIHTVHSKRLDSLVGGVQQVRYAAERVIDVSKRLNIATVIVAHVTKEGSIAGPKMLEHMVDTVAFLDGEGDVRVLKLAKNRYGSTEESIIMEMGQGGLEVVTDPTLRFVHERGETDGAVFGVTIEGQHPIVVEVQALCVQTPLAIPRRVCVGFDLNRFHMILAVIEKKLNLPLFKYDIYLNIAGGIRVSTTMVDMAVAGSVISSLKKRGFGERVVMAGELDLSGSFRLPRKFKRHIERVSSYGFSVFSPLHGYSNLYKLISSL